jgi:hypothetical protein
MRQRFSRLRGRSMAQRPGEDGRLPLTPGQRRIIGWVAAFVVIAAVAIVVGVLGGNGDGTAVAPGSSAGTSAGATGAIEFGTSIDPSSGEVTAESGTTRFGPDDTFAYAVATSGSPPPAVHVEVERTAGGPAEIVQGLAEGEQPLPEGRQRIAFSVPASQLFAVFGPGTYEMRVHVDPDGEPIATGTFELVDPVPPASASTGASP